VSSWNPPGAVVRVEAQPRASNILAGVPSVTDQAGGAAVLYYDPVADPIVYYNLAPDGQSYASVAAVDNPRGRSVLRLGGSVTQRGNCVKTAVATAVTGDGTTLFVRTQAGHGLHTGCRVTVSSEYAIAASLNGGISTFDNLFVYGKVTVIDYRTFSMPYSGLAGTSSVAFDVTMQQLLSPNGKWNELNRRLGGQLTLYANFATGSNNTANLRERVPQIVALIQAGLVNEVRGELGIGNTLLYAAAHAWTFAQIQAQLLADVPYMVQAFAQAGASTVCDMPAVQTNTTAYNTAATRFVYELIRQLASVASNRFRLSDDFGMFMDPTTGLGRQRYFRGNDLSDPTHPSNEGVVMHSFNQARAEASFYPYQAERLMRSPLDTYRADPNSLQFFDGFLAGDNTVAASTLDANCVGNVPASIGVIVTTGNAGRAVAFSYVPRGDYCGYDCIAEITAGAPGDTFMIIIANPTARLLKLLMTPGKRYFAGLDYACVPRTGTVGQVDVYVGMTANYAGMTNVNGYYTADMLNDTDNVDGVLTQPRIGGSCMPEFDLTPGITNVSKLGIVLAVTMATAGTAYLRFGRPTMRQIN